MCVSVYIRWPVSIQLFTDVCLCVSVGAEMTELADKLNFDREVIRVWFCNKRQTLKNSARKLTISPLDS